MFKFILPLLALPFACVGDDGGIAGFEREKFEEEWWYSEKFEVCICFFTTHLNAQYPQQLLMFNPNTSNISMLAAWDFEDPNYYKLDPETTAVNYGQVVFEINPPEEPENSIECWDVEFTNSHIGSREIMCECTPKEEG